MISKTKVNISSLPDFDSLGRLNAASRFLSIREQFTIYCSIFRSTRNRCDYLSFNLRLFLILSLEYTLFRDWKDAYWEEFQKSMLLTQTKYKPKPRPNANPIPNVSIENQNLISSLKSPKPLPLANPPTNPKSTPKPSRWGGRDPHFGNHIPDSAPTVFVLHCLSFLGR